MYSNYEKKIEIYSNNIVITVVAYNPIVPIMKRKRTLLSGSSKRLKHMSLNYVLLKYIKLYYPIKSWKITSADAAEYKWRRFRRGEIVLSCEEMDILRFSLTFHQPHSGIYSRSHPLSKFSLENRRFFIPDSRVRVMSTWFADKQRCSGIGVTTKPPIEDFF